MGQLADSQQRISADPDLPGPRHKFGRQLDLAIGFLLARQAVDGYWRDFRTLAGESTDWVTGYVAVALRGLVRDPAPLEKAAGALARGRHADGGWGYHAGVPSDADSTAIVVQFLADRDSIMSAGGSRWLLRAAREGGSWATYPDPGPIRVFTGLPDDVSLDGWISPSIEVTATAAHALLETGHRDHVPFTNQYLNCHRDPTRRYRAYWWVTDRYADAAVARYLTACGARKEVQALAADVGSVQNRDGGFGNRSGGRSLPFPTACAALVLAAAPKSVSAFRAAQGWLAGQQLKDGSWPAVPILRLPPPGLQQPERLPTWRVDAPGTGVVLTDRNRLFVTATCVAALTR